VVKKKKVQCEQCHQDAKRPIWTLEQMQLQTWKIEESKEQTNKSNPIIQMCMWVWLKDKNASRLNNNDVSLVSQFMDENQQLYI
jgi:hypothetical protein